MPFVDPDRIEKSDRMQAASFAPVLVDFHAAINNIIKRSLATAGIHSIIEPVGLERGDSRRPDGVTSFPYENGKALAWDATCTDSLSDSNLCSTISNPGSASGLAEDLKRRKYFQLVADVEFVPVAVETSGIVVVVVGERVAATAGSSDHPDSPFS